MADEDHTNLLTFYFATEGETVLGMSEVLLHPTLNQAQRQSVGEELQYLHRGSVPSDCVFADADAVREHTLALGTYTDEKMRGRCLNEIGVLVETVGGLAERGYSGVHVQLNSTLGGPPEDAILCWDLENLTSLGSLAIGADRHCPSLSLLGHDYHRRVAERVLN